jgi:molybdopterin converting factor small subunit
MAKVSFTANIQRHVACPNCEAQGATLREVLEVVFQQIPAARGYLLDDQGGLRKHMTIFIDGRQVSDRRGLSDAVAEDSSIHVIQALSGG